MYKKRCYMYEQICCIKGKLDRWFARHPNAMLFAQIVLSVIFVWFFCFLFFWVEKGK